MNKALCSFLTLLWVECAFNNRSEAFQRVVVCVCAATFTFKRCSCLFVIEPVCVRERVCS